MTDPTTYQRLSERFPTEAHRTKTIGGRDLTYVDGETIISRLNDVLGFDGWAFEISQVNVLEKEVWVTGKMTVYSGERVVIREQAGGQIINRTRAGEIIELGNDIKGATTDCLKKCATLFGVGLYLYDPNERQEVAAEMAAAKRENGRPKAAAATSAANQTTKASPGASTPAASGAAPSSSSTTATSARSEPTQLKTKLELIADVQKGLEYARSLGLDPSEVDCMPMNRAQIEEVLESLREQCRQARAGRAAS